MSHFTTADVPSMAGRTVIVTGANSGIGKVTARVLAERGARVVMAVRSLDKGHAAARGMTGEVEVRRLDLADLGSVRAFARDVTEPVDVLINNAGLSVPPLSRTADGFELQFGTNHLGHFALTNLLLPRITGRVVTVASLGARMGSIDLSDLNWERRRYGRYAAYGQSKLANLLFTAELQRRLSAVGSRVTSNAAHPGIAVTNLVRRDQSSLRSRAEAALYGLVGQSDEVGALPTLLAATAAIPGNSYAGPSGFLELRGAPVLVERTARARDAGTARQLWEASEALTATRFPLAATQAA